ncbi:CocE/NonD family hydrolase [Aestuariivirga sp. YIM B02566]|uniref:CocE/NonD family hydrolase n=1 Tax=Taklimakanibacter albus TaxID=2800327 RepID=A0ACC5RC44_9HYPH|nr:CocE/NonD family hydrolase [Aestuariivirga sp. YIM B02566]MBK1870271.1 CocE/NonD family hydrolase [Aestuariivirga sp. YIM B02566]
MDFATPQQVKVSGVTTVETHWIPLQDGRRLAARLFLPADATKTPVPAILEYIPYRRRDGTRTGDEQMHLWFAANGFAGVRVDIAGMGDSDGILEDEYVKREQDDALEIIDHLGRQPWCSGAVGMIGISWGGFSGLQAAARRPPNLKAVVTLCSTDDRYACDAHYEGGLLINDNFGWGGALFGYAALPPDPAIVGKERWRELWRQRLDHHSLFPATWLRHQRRDAFWKHGSVCEDYSAITCPVLAVGGWLDGYTSAIFRLVENMPGLAKGISGPWGHTEPQAGTPGPSIGFLQECKRWFDHWLKGIDNGVEADPAMRLWLMDDAKPASHMDMRPGRWLGFPAWPSPAISHTTFHLTEWALTAGKPESPANVRSVCSPLTTGLHAQEWCPYGQGRIAAEGARDQRPDDGGSLCYDTEPLRADLPIMGQARLTLRIAADTPQAMVACRLTSVAPDGTSAFVTYAILNLAHRESHEFPKPMTPGVFEEISLVMKPVGQIIPKGHRLRLAISSSYWPMAWPSPELTTITVDPNGAQLSLPLVSDESTLAAVSFERPVMAQPGPVTVKAPARQLRHIETDLSTERTSLVALSDDGRYVFDETGTEMTSWRRKEYAITHGDPASCATTVTFGESFDRPDWRARVESRIEITCDRTTFRVTGSVKTYDGDELFMTRDYDELIPRDNM